MFVVSTFFFFLYENSEESPNIETRAVYFSYFNKIILHVRAFSDSIYKSNYYPLSKSVLSNNGEYPKYDILEYFIEEAHKRDIHVLLDLVPGHTSEEHEWFLESKKAEKNEYSDRYVWTSNWIQGVPGHPYIGGEADRDGCYMLNFFKC